MLVFASAHGRRALAISRNFAVIVRKPVCEFTMKLDLTAL